MALRPSVREHDRDGTGVRFRGLLDALPDALLVVDATGRVVLANRAAGELFGAPTLVGRAVDELLPAAGRGRRADGGEFAAEVVAGMLDPGDGPMQVMRVRDLTDSRRAEERFRLLSEVASDVAFAYRVEGRKLTVEWVAEDAFRRLTGWSVDEWKEAGGWRAVVHPDDRDVLKTRVAELVRTGRALTTEYRIVTRDGRVRWVRATGRAVSDPRGGVVVYGGATDVTEVRLAQAALAESEAHLREAQAVAHLGSWHWDVAGGDVTWSDELYRVYGLDPAAFTPSFEGYLAHVHPDDRQSNLDHVQAALERDEPYDHEYRIVRPDGEVRRLFTRGVVTRDADGAPLAMHGTCWDVTERHEAEERYRAVSELTSDVAVAFHVGPDGEAVVDWVTGGHESLTGYTVEETATLGWRNLVHPLDRPTYEDRVGSLEVGETDDSEVRIVRVDGDVRHARIRMRRIPAEPDVMRFVGAVQDLTEQKAAERRLHESEERYRRVSELMSDVAYSYHLDEDGRAVVDWATEGVERLTGYSIEEAVAMRGWREMIVPEDRPAYELDLDRLVAGQDTSGEFRILAKGGDVRWLEISARAEVTPDGVFRVFGAARDVTEHKRSELALAESEASLREAQEVAQLGSWSYDERAASLVWSDEMFRIHGLEPGGEPLTMERYSALVHPDDRPALAASSAEVVRARTPYDFEYRIVRPDGEVRWLHARGRPVVAGGAVMGMRGTVLDVTERKDTELALAESESRLRESQRVASLGHFRRDVASGAVEWSDELYRIHGLEPGGVDVTMEWLESRVHPHDLAGFRRSVVAAVADGTPSEHEYRILRSDGEARWLHTRFQAEQDADGRPVAVAGVTQDVTERRRGEDLHRVVSEMVSDILFSFLVVDGALVLEWATPAFEWVTGHPVEPAVGGQLFRPITHPDDVPLLDEAEVAVLAGVSHVAEIRVVTRASGIRWLRLYAQPVLDDVTGEVVRVYGAAQDVTTRNEAEDALRRAYEQERNAVEGLRAADRMKDEFLSTASHELRTPLTAIVGFASALSRGRNMDDDMRDEITAKLERNALSLGTMVERLLDFSRLEAGAVRIETRPLDPSEVLARSLEMLASELDGHPVEVALPAGCTVRGDAAALTHVLTNLLGNAAKYSPPDVPIRVTAAVEADMVRFAVEDAGPGMPPEVAARVFDRFFRGPQQPAGQRGSGIGLSIARSYVELMAGRIWVESAEGVGTRFCFSLPAAAWAESSGQGAPAP